MSDLQPLLSRDRYSDEEWALSKAGLCDWDVEFGNGRGVIHCKKPSDPDSFYRWCTEHDQQARDEGPSKYGQ
jgi:hypothetical protein